MTIKLSPPLLLRRPRCLIHRAPSLLLLRPISSSAARSHDDLTSFLQHATQTKLPQDTTVYVGTIYEYTVMQALSRLGMTLIRTGGRGDRGVDLTGTWTPPTPYARTLKMFIQCKAEQRRTGPKFLREMEGSMAGAEHALGVLAAVSTATPGTIQHLVHSKQALAYCSVATLEEGGYIKQFVWNAAATEMLGTGLGVTVKYREKDGDGLRQEVALTLDGRIIGGTVGEEGAEEKARAVG